MLLVMPVCNYDLALARNLSVWMRELGPEPRHRALLVWAPEVPAGDRQFILENFQATFPKVNQMEPRLPADAVGWPDAPNVTFEYVVHYCCVEAPCYAGSEPWFFFEADQTPVREGWLDAMQEEYTRLGKPCMGVLEQSWMVRPDGSKFPAGKHLVGTAVYPHYFHALTNRFRNCRGTAFDVVMQGDLVDNGHCAHTNLMLHCWLTENFRRSEDGTRIVCDRREGRLNGQIGYSLNRDVDPNAGFALVHGCKDGSLLRLLRAERNARLNPAPVKTEVETLEAELAKFPIAKTIMAADENPMAAFKRPVDPRYYRDYTGPERTEEAVIPKAVEIVEPSAETAAKPLTGRRIGRKARRSPKYKKLAEQPV